jgi:peptidoglycan/xylan/chitin deacetylase (PgdA/CDA1 family)
MRSHSVMFHHFHGQGHPEGQGSISAEQFDKIIRYLSLNFNLLSSDDYSKACIDGVLGDRDICLSFDDGLLCQYEIALPVLDAWSLKAYFFLCSKPLVGGVLPIELFRYFRTVAYNDVEDFYADFFELSHRLTPESFGKAKLFCSKNIYRSEFDFYTPNDRLFRFFRDYCVDEQTYENLMFMLLEKSGLALQDIKKKLWMDRAQVRYLHNTGHSIGLHSYNHPTTVDRMGADELLAEYRDNYSNLCEVIGGEISAVAYPCGNCNVETIKIMDQLGIKIGFMANMKNLEHKSLLQMPREDHINVLAEVE